MKFSCDRCQTRYSIGDEKVRGKVLKIRCKTCGNIIVVREATAVGEAAYAAAAAASSGAAGGAPRAQPPMQQKPAGGPEPEWFVAIKGQQHGPVRKDDVIRWLREGRISDRSFLWNETLPAWSRLRELPDFQAALQAAQQEPAGRRGPPPPPPSEEGAEVVNLEQARQQRMAREGQAPPASDPFAAVGNGPGAAADNAPRDSTRVFIMQAGLHNRSKKHQVVAAVAGVVIVLLAGLFVLDWKGVIEIPGLHGVVNVVTGNSDAPKDDGFALLGFDEVAPPASDPCHLRGDCKPIKVARKSGPRGGGGGGLNLGGGGVGDINMDGQNTTQPGQGGGVLRADDQLVGLDPVEIAKLRAVVGQGPGPTGPRAPSEAPAIPIDDVRLSPEAVKQVVDSKRGGYEDCVASGQKGGEPLPAGKLKVAFVVENTGKVSSVAFAPSRVAAMGAGQCIIKLVKHLRFPTFQGAPEEAEFSLIIQ